MAQMNESPSGVATKSVAGQRINALLHFQERCFGTVRATHMCDCATDFIKAELQVGLTFSILGCNQCARTRPRAIQPMLEQPPSSRPSKICRLRFHSAALFTC
jgi:hypothetical protein